uniref:Uncharacterized protein n=1 Tax=Arundo donax TaxID=35708 RepID=A0A0A9C5W3_ARUDO
MFLSLQLCKPRAVALYFKDSISIGHGQAWTEFHACSTAS